MNVILKYGNKHQWKDLKELKVVFSEEQLSGEGSGRRLLFLNYKP